MNRIPMCFVSRERHSREERELILIDRALKAAGAVKRFPVS